MAVGNRIVLAVAIVFAGALIPFWRAGSQGLLEEANRQEWRCSDPHRAPRDRVEGCRWLMEFDASAANLIALANVLRLTKDFDNALAVIARANDDLPAVLLVRAEIHAVHGDYALAIADGDKIVALYPALYTSYSDRCWIRAIADRDLDLAAADCSKALALAPHDATALDGMGLVQFRRHDLKSAIAEFSAAIESRPQLSWALYMRGVSECLSGDIGNGKADIAAGKERQPYIASDPGSYGIDEPLCASAG